jgi:hypothetical protein
MGNSTTEERNFKNKQIFIQLGNSWHQLINYAIVIKRGEEMELWEMKASD